MKKRFLPIVGCVALGLFGCNAVRERTLDLPTVKIAELIASPEKYDGQRILVEGWAMRDFEDYNLYPSRSAACSGRGERTEVGAEWDDSHLSYRSMREGLFEATFENELLVKKPDGSFVISTGMLFGPLKNIRVVKWKSAELPPCR